MRFLSDLTAERLEAERAVDAAVYIKCAIERRRSGGRLEDLFARHRPNSPHLDLVRDAANRWSKGVVDPMDVSTAGDLLPVALSRSLIALSTPYSIVPRLNAVSAPFVLRIPYETSAACAYWVDPGGAKPLTAAAVASTALPRRCASALTVVSNELLKFSDLAVDQLLAGLLSRGLAQFIDTEFCDPSSPYSVTSGLSPVAATGTPAGDLTALLNEYVNGGGKMESATIILSSSNAVAAKIADPELGRDLTRQGGMIGGLPCVASDSAGDAIIAIDVARTLIADQGEVAIDLTRQASLQMVDGPQGSPSSGGEQLVSLFQRDQTGIRIERYINWQALSGAAAYLVDHYLTVGSP